LFIVASKSGTTLEPNILERYFFDKLANLLGAEQAGARFIAITDPQTELARTANRQHFRKTFTGNPAIGGRYSVLSPFGLVPAGIMGIDVAALIASARRMVRACNRFVPSAVNPGAVLGATLATAAKRGIDKVTIIVSPPIADFGAWLEQLLAESTGKNAKGLIPVEGEGLAAPERYGDDRLFVYVRFDPSPDNAQDKAVAALEKAGKSVVRISLAAHEQIGQEFFRWEFAVAVAGAMMGLNPFDQPDVEAAKEKARELTDAYDSSHALPAETPLFEESGVTLFADGVNAEAIKKDGASGNMARLHPSDYFALLAFVSRNERHQKALQAMRQAVRDRKHVATCVGFGPRYLHATGQLYKGGPNSGVFLEVTCDAADDVQVPDHAYSFGVVSAAQARGDFSVLNERGRRALRVHLGKNAEDGLVRLQHALEQALS
jgi:transaldolase/glucose-6-phosphate isomerase